MAVSLRLTVACLNYSGGYASILLQCSPIHLHDQGARKRRRSLEGIHNADPPCAAAEPPLSSNLLPHRSGIGDDVSLRQFHHLCEKPGCIRTKEFHPAYSQIATRTFGNIV